MTKKDKTSIELSYNEVAQEIFSIIKTEYRPNLGFVPIDDHMVFFKLANELMARGIRKIRDEENSE